VTAPPPRENTLLLGQDDAERTLAEAVASGRMHHAWLITGPAGIGKATLAYRFARHLLAGVAPQAGLFLPPDNPTFRRVAAGTHADLLTVEREWDEKRKKLRGEIVIETVRGIAGFLRLTPAEGGWRVVIVDGAEDINRNAANALLKVLEEPPPRAVLILVCSAAGRLLPTIRSRCRRLRMNALDAATMDSLLARYLPEADAARRERLASLAEGSIGRALTLADADGIPAAELVGRLLDALPRPDPGLGHDIADALGRSEDAFSTFMDLLRDAIAGAVRDVARGRPDPDQLRLIGERPLAAWVEIWQGLGAVQAQTEGLYLDKRQAIVSSVGMLASQN
jgi:DNA polymerase-3 subunit delta'